MGFKKHNPGCQCCACKCENTENRCIDNKTSCRYQIEFFDLANQDCGSCADLNSPDAVFVVEDPFPSEQGCAWTQAIDICGFTEVRLNLIKAPFGSGTVVEVVLSGGLGIGSISYQKTYAAPINCNALVNVTVPFLSDSSPRCAGAGSHAVVNSL